MHTTFDLRRTWAPQLPHTLLIVLMTAVVVLLAIAFLVAAGFMVQNLTGGAPLIPMQPEAGLDL
jgi:hypothetical protein